MHRLAPTVRRITLLLAVMWVAATSASAQRHSLGSAPPTAPSLPPAVSPRSPATPSGQPAPVVRQPASTGTRNPATGGAIAAVSSGLGAIQFTPASVSLAAPQSLVRQLSSDDERTRLGALAALGAPAQYLVHGHVPVPHSMQMDMLQLSNSDDLDAILTVELDQHVLSAILVPETLTWRRVATLTFASSFSAGATTPSNFMRPLRSWLEPGRYRAVYHATVDGINGDFTENEADVRVINGKAAVVISFVSGARQCDNLGAPPTAHPGCEIIQRWLEPDPSDPTHHFTLITGIGHFPLHEAALPLTQSRNYRLTRLRSFACQPFLFSESAQHFEATANSAPCAARDPQPARPALPSAEHP